MYRPKRASSATEVTMVRNKMWRWVRVAALAATVSIGFGSLAWGQDRDDYYNGYRDQASDQGYRRGIDDGSRKGQFDRERGRRFNFKNDDWEDSRGFEHWMGSKGHYKQAYRDGYERGYRRAYGNGRDRDDYRGHDRDDWR
jgi:hypothetical protein